MLTTLERVEIATICLLAMTKEERKIFIERYIDELTLTKIAQSRGVTGMAISNRIEKARIKAFNAYQLIAVLDGIGIKEIKNHY
tara:strand:- start:1508 stop:1759 length:252 start_codon:yes stop_codon:yes gene_type:complete